MFFPFPRISMGLVSCVGDNPASCRWCNSSKITNPKCFEGPSKISNKITQPTVAKSSRVRYIKYGSVCCLIYLASILTFVVTLSAPFWIKLYFYQKNQRVLQNAVRALQIDQIKQALDVGGAIGRDNQNKLIQREEGSKFPDELGLIEDIKKNLPRDYPDLEVQEFVRQVMRLRKKMEDLKENHFVFGGVQGLFKDFADISKTPLYQELKSIDCQATNFVLWSIKKILSPKLEPVINDLGYKRLQYIQNKEYLNDPEQFAIDIAKYLDKTNFSFDNGFFSFIWMVCHPGLASEGYKSKALPYSDGSYENPYTVIEGDPDKEFVHYSGPRPGAIFPLLMDALYACHGDEQQTVFCSRQDAIKKPELEHSQPWSCRNDSQNMTYSMIGQDKSWVGDELLAKNTSLDIEEFFTNYRCRVDTDRKTFPNVVERRSHSGYYIPGAVLSDTELDAAFAAAKAFCKDLSTSDNWENANILLQAQVMQLVIDEFISSAILATQATTGKKVAFFSCCKQDIDRGGVGKAVRDIVRGYQNATPGQKKDGQWFSPDIKKRLVWYLTMRSQLVDNRKIKRNKAKKVLFLLKCLSPKKNSSN